VIISVIDNNICWYPLPYRRHNRDNYNSHHHGGGPRGNQNGGHPTPNPTPTPPVGQTPPIEERRRPRTPPLSQTPPTAVVSVPASEFGRGRNFRTPPLAVATTVISQTPDIIVAPPVLPSYKELGGRVSKEIVAETPPILAGTDRRVVRTGAAERKADAPLDNELRSRRIFGDRAPLAVPAATEPRRVDPAQPSEPRRTGAVERRPIIKSEPDNDTPIIEQPTRREQRKFEPTPTKRDEAPTYVPPTRENPRQEPPMRRESPKYEPPPRQETPKYEPPTRQESPKSDPPPRNDPPPTRNDSPPKSDPPPQKSDGPVDRKGKDGRGR
jgi:hypothetical protein